VPLDKVPGRGCEQEIGQHFESWGVINIFPFILANYICPHWKLLVLHILYFRYFETEDDEKPPN